MKRDDWPHASTERLHFSNPLNGFQCSCCMLCWYLVSVHSWRREVSNVDESAGKQSKQNIAFPFGISKKQSHKWYVKYAVVHAYIWYDNYDYMCTVFFSSRLPACRLFLPEGYLFRFVIWILHWMPWWQWAGNDSPERGKFGSSNALNSCSRSSK